MSDKVYKVSRVRIYHLPPRPGFAWHYVYDVHGPGCHKGGNSGDTMSWVRWLCKKLADGSPYTITCDWKEAK